MENSAINTSKENPNKSIEYFLFFFLEDMEKYEILNKQFNEIVNNITTKFDFINFTKDKLRPIKEVNNKNIIYNYIIYTYSILLI